MAFDTFPAVVTHIRMVTPTVLCLGFRRQDGQLLDFKPGHFVNVHFQDEDGETHRSYSVANPPGEDHFEIAVAPVEDGRATRYLFGLKEGDQVDISGPYGRFVLREENHDRYVLVGTGTGITPYRAMLPQLAQRMQNSQARVEVLVGVRSREEFLFAEDFLAAFAHGIRRDVLQQVGAGHQQYICGLVIALYLFCVVQDVQVGPLQS